MNIPTVITRSCFPYIVILDCICDIPSVITMSCFPDIVILDCICEYTYFYGQELLPLFCDLMIAFVNIRTTFYPRVASLTL